MRSPLVKRATLRDALSPYTSIFDIRPVIGPIEYSFLHQFRGLSAKQVKFHANPTTAPSMRLLREAAELYTLLLILHRDTRINALQSIPRLSLATWHREEIQPRVQLTFALHDASAYSDQLDDWKVLLDAFNGPLGEEYYTSRQQILRLYGVDEAFVRHKVGLVTMVFEVHELPSGSSKETLLAVPRRVAELQVATRPPGDSVPENRTWLHFDDVRVDLEGMAAPAVINEYVNAWIPTPIKISELSVKLSHQWTWQDGRELAQAINRGGVRMFNLLVRSVREMAVAIAVRELVLDRTEEVAITAMIDDNWEVNSEAFEDAWKLLPPQLTKKPRLQLQLNLPRV